MISKSQIITGILSLQIDNNLYFPEKCWNDLIIVLLDSWLKGIFEILFEDKLENEFNFFDGPYSFLLKKNDQKYDLILLRNNRVLQSRQIDINEFRTNLIMTSEQIRDIVKNKGWKSSDIDNFLLNLSKLSDIDVC